MKRNLLILLSIFVLSISIKAIDFNYQGITYTILDENAKTCTTKVGYGGSNNGMGNNFIGDLVIPEIVKYEEREYSVTEIGEYSFEYNVNLTSVSLPSTIKKINRGAFTNCTNLQNVYLSEGIEIIDYSSFNTCSLLSNIKLPNTIKEIGKFAFSRTNIKKLVIPSSVIKIGQSAYSNCPIDDYIFEDGEEELQLEWHPFNYNETSAYNGNYNLYLGRNFINISPGHEKETPFYFVKNITFGPKVTKIPEYAFYTCPYLNSLYIPDNITSLGRYAFQDCVGLETVSIGTGISLIGTYTFKTGKTINEVIIRDGNSQITLNSNAFHNTPIENLYIGRQWIGNNNAFNNITNVKIGLNVYEIPENAFKNLNKLYSIILEKNVKTIGQSAFSGCNALRSVSSLNSDPPTILGPCFDNIVTSSGKLLVPIGAKNKYETANYWLEFSNIIEVENNDDKNNGDSDEYDENIINENVTIGLNEDFNFSELLGDIEANSWDSSNENIVAISNKGIGESYQYGNVYVKAKDIEGNYLAVFNVFVCPILSIEHGDGIIYNHHVLYNSRPKIFLIEGSGEYKIAGLTHDGEDIKDSLISNNGYYTSIKPITENSTLNLTLSLETTTESIFTSTPYRIFITGRHIDIKTENIYDFIVNISSLDGKIVKTTKTASFDLNEGGVYLISIENEPIKFKVLVR